jgi:hypothetical protein
MARAEEADLRKLPKSDRPKPSTGQSGPERELPYEELNQDEKLVVVTLDDDGEGLRQAMPVADLASTILSKENEKEARAKLRIRNAMRRLVTGGWVENTDRGRYKISEKGRKRLKRQNGES